LPKPIISLSSGKVNETGAIYKILFVVLPFFLCDAKKALSHEKARDAARLIHRDFGSSS